MLKSIVFADEITLWWDKQEFSKQKNIYKVYLNNVYHGDTVKTHYTFAHLQASTTYIIRIQAYNGNVIRAEKEYTFQTQVAKKRIDVTLPPYCAVGDGTTVNTKILQSALDNCQADEYIYFPKGVYLSGALNVYSNTEIYLDEGAVLQGTTIVEDYLPQIKSRFEGIERMCYRALLNMGELDNKNYGFTCSNVVIRGKGTIFGGGRPLAESMQDVERERLSEYLIQNADYVKTCETPNTIPGRVRGRLINMSNCENIVFSGLTLGFGASWNIHFTYSKNIITYGCMICSDKVVDDDGNVRMRPVWNGDGWDPDSSEDCVIFDTVFKTYDDCVAIKSGKNLEGNIINRPTKNIYIFDCRVETGHGISIGSEMSGGVENVYVWDCDLKNALCGLQVKSTKKRGGYIKNLQATDCVISTIYVRCPTYNDDGESASQPPKLSDYHYENIKIEGYTHPSGKKVFVELNGFAEEGFCLNNVSFKNIFINAKKDENVLHAQYVNNLSWENIQYKEN